MAEDIYRYYAQQSDGLRYHYSRDPGLDQGWTFEGRKLRTPTPGTEGVVPVYQYHYDQSKTYGGWRFLFSTNPSRQNEGWSRDGIAFHAFETQQPATIPFYEYRCMQSDGARFMLSEDEVVGGWTKMGIAFWAYKP